VASLTLSGGFRWSFCHSRQPSIAQLRMPVFRPLALSGSAPSRSSSGMVTLKRTIWKRRQCRYPSAYLRQSVGRQPQLELRDELEKAPRRGSERQPDSPRVNCLILASAIFCPASASTAATNRAPSNRAMSFRDRSRLPRHQGVHRSFAGHNPRANLVQLGSRVDLPFAPLPDQNE